MEETGSVLEADFLVSIIEGPVIRRAMTSSDFYVPLNTHPLVSAPARHNYKAVIETKRGGQHEHVNTNILTKNACP